MQILKGCAVVNFFGVNFFKHKFVLGCFALGVSGCLSGCGSDNAVGTGPGLSSGETAPGPLSTVKNFVFYGGSTVPDVKPKELAQRDIDCPKLDVLEGTAALRVAGTGDGAIGVNYQVSMGQTARECRIENNKVNVKIGVEGRVLIGTNGKSGTYTVPVRVVVKREKAVIYSKLTRLSITVPAGDTQAAFTHIEEGISLPLTENNPADEYDILVGFDPTGKIEKAEGRKRKK